MRIRSIRIESNQSINSHERSSSSLHGMFPLGRRPRGNLTIFGHIRQPPPQRVVTGATPAVTPPATVHTAVSQLTPAAAPQKKKMAVAAKAQRHKSRATEPKQGGKAQDFDTKLHRRRCPVCGVQGFPLPTQEKLKV